MDVHPDKSHGLGLPQPSTAQSAASFSVSPNGHHGREIRPITMQSPGSPPLPHAMSPVVPSTDPPAVVSDNVAASTDGVSNDDNSDALDEEWVSKAKAIVERTKNDPYAESKELSRAKADYLRVRYNKQLKVSEEQT